MGVEINFITKWHHDTQHFAKKCKSFTNFPKGFYCIDSAGLGQFISDLSYFFHYADFHFHTIKCKELYDDQLDYAEGMMGT